MRRAALVIAILLILGSCENSDHFGFTRIENSIHYKLITIGDEDQGVKHADFISIQIKTYADSSLLAYKTFNRVSDRKSFPNYINELLDEANVGDSILVLGNSQELSLPKLYGKSLVDNPVPLSIEILVTEAYSDSAMRQQLAIERLRRDFELEETATLNRILDSLGITDSHLVNGIYIKPIHNGGGDKPEKGDFVSTNYVMTLPNGRTLVDTYNSEPFEYQTGKPGQAITGFAIAVYEINAGGEYLVVIPSSYGFGARGSSSGIVPPYSVLICKIELLGIS